MADGRGDGRLPRLSETHCRRRGLYDQDLGHLARIVTEIEAGPKTDFQHASIQALTQLCAPGIHLRCSQRPVHKRRKNMIVPDAHATKASVVAVIKRRRRSPAVLSTRETQVAAAESRSLDQIFWAQNCWCQCAADNARLRCMARSGSREGGPRAAGPCRAAGWIDHGTQICDLRL